MLWEIEIQPLGPDPERQRVGEEYDLLTHAGQGGTLPCGSQVIQQTSRGYLVRGSLQREAVERLMHELLLDSLVEKGQIRGENSAGVIECGGPATVLLKPGVMDPAAMSVLSAANDLGIVLDSVLTFRRYYWSGVPVNLEAMRKVLCNEAIERIVDTDLSPRDILFGTPYTFRLITVPLRDADDDTLQRISRQGQLSLSLAEMHTIQAHFRSVGRDPTDVELETLAQTWSEHCSHKTLKGLIEFTGADGTTGATTTSSRKPSSAPPRRFAAGWERTTGASASSRTTPASSALTKRTTSASRWRRTTIPRPSSLMAEPTPGWAV